MKEEEEINTEVPVTVEEKLDDEPKSQKFKMPELKKKVYPHKTIKDIELEAYDQVKKEQSNSDFHSDAGEENEEEENEGEDHTHQTNRQLTPNELYFEKSLSTGSLRYFYKKLGHTYSFFADKDGNPLFIIGPQWPMYLCLSSLVLGVIGVFLYLFCDYYSRLFKVIGMLLSLCFMLSYTYTFVINPGYPVNDNDRRNGEPREDFRFCTDCKFWVSLNKNVNHCFDCGICVEGYDHHCPWTSKCIGKKNLYSFYAFMTSILLIFGYFICGITTAKW